MGEGFAPLREERRGLEGHQRYTGLQSTFPSEGLSFRIGLEITQG